MSGRTSPRILIVRPSALGDVCRTVPVLASLRAAEPDARIDWLVQDDFVDAIRAHPALDEALAFPRSRFARWWRNPRVLAEVLRWLGGLRGRRYDLVVDCQGLGRSGLMTWMTGAGRRVGLRHARELGWLGYTVRHRTSAEQHTVDEMLSLLEPIGAPVVADLRLYVPDEDAVWWARQRVELDLGDGSYAVLAPTTRWPSKRWPAERWGDLAGPLRDRGLDRLVILAAPGELDQVEGVVSALASAGVRPIDLSGRTSVGGTMAVIADATLVVANDSAPLHMAVGFDRPTVGLFGPTDPARVGPYPPGHDRRAVVRADVATPDVSFKQRGLGDRLMRSIGETQVIDAIDAVLRTRRPAGEGLQRACS